MSDTDDHEWLDALAGRAPATTAARREASALRDALRTAAAPETTTRLNPRDARRERQLLERAAREGVLPRATARKPRFLPIAAGLLLALTAGMLIRLQSRAPEFEVMRGTESGVVRIEAADPAALKARIRAALQSAGVETTGYEALGVQGIDADLPRPLTPEVRRVLAVFDIPEPADGVLRIEIRKSE